MFLIYIPDNSAYSTGFQFKINIYSWLGDVDWPKIYRYKQPGLLVPKLKPEPIANYNKFMSGIDRQDQINSYYPFLRKTPVVYSPATA